MLSREVDLGVGHGGILCASDRRARTTSPACAGWPRYHLACHLEPALSPGGGRTRSDMTASCRL
ncbi:hypothetical protein HMPREF0321_2878 [Dermacoccus sp. Ellin185]|nr:hypothetical protein HMPREF0321_2878 [Dermacoccus sp. Ellin185]